MLFVKFNLIFVGLISCGASLLGGFLQGSSYSVENCYLIDYVLLLDNVFA